MAILAIQFCVGDSRAGIVGMMNRNRASLGQVLQRVPHAVVRLLGDKAGRQIEDTFRGAKINALLLNHYAKGLAPSHSSKPFILFGLMRSGTTLFGDLLGQHPDLTWLGESFVQRAYRPEWYLNGLAHAASTVCLGIKVFSFQLSEKPEAPANGYGRSDIDRAHRIIEFLRARHWNFICLQRSDVFAQCVSFARASQTGIWHETNELATNDNRKICLSLIDFERYLKAFLTFGRYEEEIFAGAEMLRLNYESNLQNSESYQASAKTAFEFLGLPEAPVKSKYLKMGMGPLDQQIENYEEVAELAQRMGVKPTT